MASRRIVLIGFMGSGKSAIGRALATQRQSSFIDTDKWIEASEGRRITDIFEKHGEAYFRDLEAQALRHLALNAPLDAVIATGGGIIEVSENHRLLRQLGTVIYLSASLSTVAARLSHDRQRPLWQDRRRAEQRYWQRLDQYRRAADAVVLSDERPIESHVTQILSVLHARQASRYH